MSLAPNAICLHLLDKSLTAGGVQIFIGEESGYDILDNCSVVASPYDVDGEVVGVLGVIGPTRMAYERVIPDCRCDRATAWFGLEPSAIVPISFRKPSEPVWVHTWVRVWRP